MEDIKKTLNKGKSTNNPNLSSIGNTLNPGIYLAGKWKDHENHYDKMNQLINLGFHITHDWPKNQEIYEDMRTMCYVDIKGVQSADYVVPILDDSSYAYRGTHCEIGVAMATGKKIFIYYTDDYFTQNVFMYHDNIRMFNNWEELKREITKDALLEIKDSNS